MAMRTALAANFQTVISRQRDYHESEAIVLKASAGASERLTWIMVDHFESILSDLKAADYHLVSAVRSDASIAYDQYKYPKRVCLCIGGERRGLSRAILDASDGFVHIPYDKEVRIALSAVSATAVLTFEMVRQRKK
jgi:23S rRNA (guanosine2251-2'-O)-methyltransferase